ncbi:MAG: hypothetical protein IKI93_08045, partial [Clostridia bacterium]|nr:hypothetical protein [Clostridia bacterium]
KNFRITGMRRLDTDSKPTLLITNAPGSHGTLTADGNTCTYRLAEDSFRWAGDFDTLCADSDAQDTLN